MVLDFSKLQLGHLEWKVLGLVSFPNLTFTAGSAPLIKWDCVSFVCSERECSKFAQGRALVA